MSAEIVLRPFQERALAALESPGHLICIAPTGAGKSLVYERLAARAGRRTLLVSPLVALARQQRERLRSAGISVKMTAGGQADPPPSPGWAGTWIASPESLCVPGRRERLRAWRPDLLVVDECHCVWEWGERFRPAFGELPALAGEPGIERSLWLTATLPAAARERLLSGMPATARARVRVQGAFALPPRLRLEVRRVPWCDRAGALLEWILRAREAGAGNGIVFVETRAGVERVTRLLNSAYLPAINYHAGLAAEERRNVETRVGYDGAPIVVATSAFGMGMDHPSLRWAVALQAPRSLLALAQAIGRSGRDTSRDSAALVLWDADDFRLAEALGASACARARGETRSVRDFLATAGCRRARLSAHFDPAPARGLTNCGACDFCAPASVPFLPTVNPVPALP